MPIFGVVINDDGDVLNVRQSPHQADDCDGLVYKATDKDGQDIYLFLINANNQGNAVVFARQSFYSGEFVALDPIWQPGSMWPATADEGLDQQAVVQIYSRQLGRGYITTVPTHKRTNPFIDHFGENIMWAYMRDIETKMVNEEAATIERWKEQRKQSEVPQEREAVAEPTKAKQLSFDFG